MPQKKSNSLEYNSLVILLSLQIIHIKLLFTYHLIPVQGASKERGTVNGDRVGMVLEKWTLRSILAKQNKYSLGGCYLKQVLADLTNMLVLETLRSFSNTDVVVNSAKTCF